MNPTTRFSNRVADYVRYRPGYPGGVIEILTGEAGLTPLSSIADIGSGTGISSRLFLEHGCPVWAVEPNAEMRQAAETLLADFPGFHSVEGQAEATTLADSSVDLVVAAQAFHWFAGPAARREFTRILKPGARVVLLWNERRTHTSPLLRDYEALLLHHAPDYAAVRHENITPAVLTEFFDGEFLTWTLPNHQTFDLAGLTGRLLSCSYAPAAGQPGHLPMLAALSELFSRYEESGHVRFAYDTRIWIGR